MKLMVSIEAILEVFAELGILFKGKARGRLKPQHIAHMWGFQPTDNAAIGQKTGSAKTSLNQNIHYINSGVNITMIYVFQYSTANQTW